MSYLRSYDLAELLGPERAARFLTLQAMGKLARSPEEHVEYKRLTADRNRERAKVWMRRHVLKQQLPASSTNEAPDMDQPIAPAPVPTPSDDERPFAPSMPEASSAEPAHLEEPEGDEPAFPSPPDAPEVIERRKAELRGYILEGYEEWSKWIKAQGVWTPPQLLQRWLARFGAGAAEGYGVLDHEPRRDIMAWIFAGGTFAAFVPFTLIALRNWRRGGGARTIVDAEAEREGDPHWGDA